MTANDVKVILGTALVTATTVVALWQVPTAVATQEQGGAAKNAAILQAGDVQISVRMTKSEYKAGEKPVVLVTATSRADCERSVKLDMGMTSTRPTSPMARMVALPQSIWSTPCQIAVGAGQTKEIEFPTDVAVSAGNVLQLSARAGDSTVAVSAVVAGVDGKLPVTGPGLQIQLLQSVQLPRQKDA